MFSDRDCLLDSIDSIPEVGWPSCSRNGRLQDDQSGNARLTKMGVVRLMNGLVVRKTGLVGPMIGLVGPKSRLVVSMIGFVGP